MMAINTVPINGDALKDGILAKGFKLTEASEMLGFDGSYISRIAHNGEIKEPLLRTINYLFRVEPDTYVITNEPDDPEPEQLVITTQERAPEIVIVPEISAEQWARLEELIVRAVKEALK